MIALLLAALLLPAPSEDEETSFRSLLAIFQAEPAEPEPPPGVRAPGGSERHQRAAAAYAKALGRWQGRLRTWRSKLAGACARHLERYPRGRRRADVRALRGLASLRVGDFAGARRDLEASLAAGSREERAVAATRGALVTACRALGDYRAALRYGGDDPDLLEEAGEVKRAIAAARAAGEPAKAERWGRIGKKFAGELEIPAGVKAVVVEAGRRLATERRVSLKNRFSSKKVAFLSASAPYPAVYLLDGGGFVRAIDPRPDTWEHRLRRLLGTG